MVNIAPGGALQRTCDAMDRSVREMRGEREVRAAKTGKLKLAGSTDLGLACLGLRLMQSEAGELLSDTGAIRVALLKEWLPVLVPRAAVRKAAGKSESRSFKMRASSSTYITSCRGSGGFLRCIIALQSR